MSLESFCSGQEEKQYFSLILFDDLDLLKEDIPRILRHLTNDHVGFRFWTKAMNYGFHYNLKGARQFEDPLQRKIKILVNLYREITSMCSIYFRQQGLNKDLRRIIASMFFSYSQKEIDSAVDVFSTRDDILNREN